MTGTIFCPQGTINADCGDAGLCCGPLPNGDDVSSDDGSEMFDAPLTDVESALDAAIIGSCNGSPCASGCSCVPFSPDAGSLSPDGATLSTDGATLPPDAAPLTTDAGGGVCICASADASTDAESVADADGAPDASADADIGDAAEAGDALTPEDGSAEADGSGGVILCAAECTCTSTAASACVCP